MTVCYPGRARGSRTNGGQTSLQRRARLPKTLLDVINRTPNPAPWSQGDNIPWDDPAFSERMLAEHLSQDHELASRRSGTIDLQVGWIFSQALGARPGRVLDLACGPGLYTSRLARKGCECIGVDFSPASIRHASELAAADGLECTYHHADVRDGHYGEGFDLVMMIYGQFNVFQRDRGLEILKHAHSALRSGGSLVLEIQSEDQIRKGGQSATTWNSTSSGLFSEAPHIVLQESFWDDAARTATTRFLVIAGQTGQVSTYGLSNEAYGEGDLTDALGSAGFSDPQWFPSLIGESVAAKQDLPVIVARK
jgi:SAM-dependent methyltransferase